jgi:hypothetical protein
VIARERFAMLELEYVPAAVLTAVVIASEQERVRDLAAEATRNVNEFRQTDDGRARQRETLRSDIPVLIGLDDLGFAVNEQPKGPPHRDHRQRLIRRIECEAAYDHALPGRASNNRSGLAD